VVLGLVGRPVDPGADRVAKRRPDLGVLLVDDAAVELHVAVGPVLAAGDAVDHDPGVAQEVERLARPPHHAHEQPAGRDVALVRRDPGTAVAADRPDQHELVSGEPPGGQVGDLGARPTELVPSHGDLPRRPHAS
jgi:hypothetical protein